MYCFSDSAEINKERNAYINQIARLAIEDKGKDFYSSHVVSEVDNLTPWPNYLLDEEEWHSIYQSEWIRARKKRITYKNGSIWSKNNARYVLCEIHKRWVAISLTNYKAISQPHPAPSQVVEGMKLERDFVLRMDKEY